MTEPPNGLRGDYEFVTPEDARAALQRGRGRGVRIALIDSGVEAGHPGLAGLELSDDVAVETSGVRLKMRAGEGRDVYGHGTAVASILHRIAPEAEIGSFRGLDERNQSRSFIIAECAQLAMERGYHIINCSFGCKGHVNYILDFKAWVDAAYQRGIHIVSACNNQQSNVREWPSHFPSVISVGMADTPSDWIGFRPGNMVEFVARGERLSPTVWRWTVRVPRQKSYRVICRAFALALGC